MTILISEDQFDDLQKTQGAFLGLCELTNGEQDPAAISLVFRPLMDEFDRIMSGISREGTDLGPMANGLQTIVSSGDAETINALKETIDALCFRLQKSKVETLLEKVAVDDAVEELRTSKSEKEVRH